jgi:hypothetical protein
LLLGDGCCVLLVAASCARLVGSLDSRWRLWRMGGSEVGITGGLVVEIPGLLPACTKDSKALGKYSLPPMVGWVATEVAGRLCS